VVASEIAAKPWDAYSAEPAGAPIAKAANIADPTQAMTFPVFREWASASPQLTAAVMMKLSAQPSNARPERRITTEINGDPLKPSDSR
jgi:hypothetical protein